MKLNLFQLYEWEETEECLGVVKLNMLSTTFSLIRYRGNRLRVTSVSEMGLTNASCSGHGDDKWAAETKQQGLDYTLSFWNTAERSHTCKQRTGHIWILLSQTSKLNKNKLVSQLETDEVQ